MPGFATSGLVHVSSGATLQVFEGSTSSWGFPNGSVDNMLNANMSNINGVLSYYNASSITEAVNLTGNMGVQISNGTLILTGNNNYNGTTTVSGGQLTVASTSSLPTWNSNSGKVSVAAATTLAVSAGGTWTEPISTPY